MDIGTVISWIQIAIWVIAAVLYIGRVRSGNIKARPLLKRALSSNGLIGAVIVLGLAMSGISLYLSYSANVIPKSITLNISAYDPPYPGPLQVVSDKTFEDQEVRLDGYIYERCTFKNVCFVYEGGSYGLQNSTVKDGWKVCVRDQRIHNYSNLIESLKMFSPKMFHVTKTMLQ